MYRPSLWISTAIVYKCATICDGKISWYFCYLSQLGKYVLTILSSIRGRESPWRRGKRRKLWYRKVISCYYIHFQTNTFGFWYKITNESSYAIIKRNHAKPFPIWLVNTIGFLVLRHFLPCWVIFYIKLSLKLSTSIIFGTKIFSFTKT